MKKTLLVIGGAYLAFAYYQYRNQSPIDTSSSVLTDILGKFSMNNMITSQAGKNAIAGREGSSYTVYADQAGYLTVGIGHKLTPSDGSYSAGDQVNAAQVNDWFNSDISHAENIVKRYVTSPLSQNEFDALVSAAFNLGSAVFVNANGSTTRLLDALNAGDYSSAASYLLDFSHVRVNGTLVQSAGLLARRESEQQQFLA